MPEPLVTGEPTVCDTASDLLEKEYCEQGIAEAKAIEQKRRR
jgi:hypothetical protein